MPGGSGVQGVDQLVASLADAAAELASLTVAHDTAGDLVVHRGIDTSPRRSGYLASTIGHNVVAGRLELTASADYAAIVHARNPWLARAVETSEADLLTIYTAGVQDVVDTIRGA